MIQLVHPIFGSGEKHVLSDIIDSRMVASGKYVDKFENAAVAAFGVKHAVATSNGTTALHTALLACGIKPGDKVLTTAFSFIATANSILYCGAKPVFADIDPKTFNLSPLAVEKVIKKEKGIKAVIIVHLYGMPCDMQAFTALKKKYKFILIEDCAQAHGARYKNKPVGSFGDAAAFSFYATKNVTTGEGGIITTNNPKIDALARQLINHGRDGHSNHTILGYNFRLTNLAAGVGVEQLKNLDAWSETRRENAAYLSKHLLDLKYMKTPSFPQYMAHVFHQYTIRIRADLRENLMDYLKGRGIGHGIYYSRVIYQQPLYQSLGYKQGLCPEAEKAANEVLSLPVHPALKRQELDSVINAIREFYLKYKL